MTVRHNLTTRQKLRLIQLVETGPIPRLQANYERALEALKTQGLVKRNAQEWSATKTGEKLCKQIMAPKPRKAA